MVLKLGNTKVWLKKSIEHLQNVFWYFVYTQIPFYVYEGQQQASRTPEGFFCICLTLIEVIWRWLKV